MGRTLKIIIVEDDALATATLIKGLKASGVRCKIVCHLDSVATALSFFATSPDYDLVFLDPDCDSGKGLSLLTTASLNKPIIFCAQTDEYALTAFHYNCMDYLVKPLKQKRLLSALKKYKMVEQTWRNALDLPSGTTGITPFSVKHYKKRFLVRTNGDFQLIGIGNIVCFYSENGRSFLVEASGKQFVIDFTLERLEELLDPELFFRINRKVTVSIGAIETIEDYVNNRLKVQLHSKVPIDPVVSRKRVKAFKNWLRGVV